MELAIGLAVWWTLGIVGTIIIRHWFKRDEVWEKGDWKMWGWPAVFGPLWLACVLVTYHNYK